jgi:hypothetical protein
LAYVPTYTTAAAVREELDVTAEVLPDPVANRLIAHAEDVIDDQLGARPVGPNGRKVSGDFAAGDMSPADLVGRATTIQAAILYRSPNWDTEQRVRSSGGDVSIGSPYGPAAPVVASLLNASGLRRLTTSTGGGGGRSPAGFTAEQHGNWNPPDPVPGPSGPDVE